MTQLSLFDALHRPPVYVAVDPSGLVVQGDADETLTLPHPRMAWDQARIELHKHAESGLVMWSVCWTKSDGGGGYKVGPKWGRFAENREDALFYAVRELEQRIGTDTSAEAAAILKWARGLR